MALRGDDSKDYNPLTQGQEFAPAGHSDTISELRRIVSWMDAVLGTITDGIAVAEGPRMTILYVNHTFCDIMGRQRIFLLGTSLLEHLPAECLQEYIRLQETAEGGAPPTKWTQELIMRDREGGDLPVEMAISSWGGQGKIFYTTIVRDIRERRTAERMKEDLGHLRLKELAWDLSIFQSLIQNLESGVLVEDDLRRVFIANRAFCRIFNIPSGPEILKGQDYAEVASRCKSLFTDPEHFPRRIVELIACRRAVMGEELVLADGRIFERDYIPIIAADDRCIGHMWQYRNVTERRQLERRVFQSEKMAAVGQLAGGVAHEINNPIGIILGFAQSVARGIEGNNPLALPLRSIEREAVRCKELVQNLLSFSRSSAPEHREETDLNTCVRQALSLVLAQTKVKEVQVVQELDPAPPRITANKNQLQQVVINLCNNAIDAMPKGGKLTVKAGQIVRGGAVWTRLQIADTGTGIPKKLQSRIFEPFFTTKEVGRGTGLGLALVHEIVQKHGGMIELSSEVGKGTTFSILFPALKKKAAAS